MKKDRTLDEPAEIVTPTYRGPDRRKRRGGEETVRPSIRLKFNDVGHATWGLDCDEPRRRIDDDTVDLLKALNDDSLSIEDDDPEDSVNRRTLVVYGDE